MDEDGGKGGRGKKNEEREEEVQKGKRGIILTCKNFDLTLWHTIVYCGIYYTLLLPSALARGY